MHARTHGHTSVECSSEALRHTQTSGTETRPVEPAQNTDHELIYQRAAVSQPSMQNDISMALIITRAQSTGCPRSQSNGTLQQGSRSIWILGSSIVYWTGQEVASRQGGRHLGIHNVGFQGFWFGKRGMV